ncbi:MAG: ATP-binding cassette domain-containing protein [Clostridiales bacterium]|nr:ATP-binding cassette domain-containing protein [Clostridiales bacterium]
MYLTVSKVSKYFGKQKVLSDVSFSLEKGKIHGVIGHNGSGKTLLFKCICGYLSPDQGDITVNGKRIGKDIAFPENMGLILETPGFLPHCKGENNLEMLYTIRQPKNNATICAALQKVGLLAAAKKPVSTYSLGMRQRLGIAQAIMENPDFLLLDEPFNALDAQGVSHLRDLFLSLKAQGTTIVFSSHNPIDIQLLCDSVTCLDAGQVVKNSDFFYQSFSPFL